MPHSIESIVVPMASAVASAPADLSLLKNIGLVVFFTIFIGIGVRLLLTRRSAFDHAASLPLDDDAGLGLANQDSVKERRGHG